MTVCIAAASFNLKQIITVSDMRIETQTASIDDALAKFRASPFGWHCLFSASDISRFESIWARINAILLTLDPLASQISAASMEAAIERAYSDERRHMAEVMVLSPWTMDLPAFELNGRAQFGDDLFREMHAKIVDLKTEVELLVFGFEHGVPHLMQVGPNGVILTNRPAGPHFGAIGAGQYTALDSLYSHADIERSHDIGYVVYRLCEAKFAAEATPGVGPDTTVAVFDPRPLSDDLAGLTSMLKTPRLLNPRDVKKAKDLWTRRKNALIPERILCGLRSGLTLDDVPRRLLGRAFVDSTTAYLNTRDEVVKLRDEGFINDAQWKDFEECFHEIRDASAVFMSGMSGMDALKEVNAVVGFTALQRLMVAAARIDKIRQSAIRSRSDSGNDQRLISGE